MHGAIPWFIGELVNLDVLELNFNRLGGYLPVSLGNLVNLRILEVFHNEIEGPIPEELTALGNLKKLYVPVLKLGTFMETNWREPAHLN